VVQDRPTPPELFAGMETTWEKERGAALRQAK
jgi:hypothetical protein